MSVRRRVGLAAIAAAWTVSVPTGTHAAAPRVEVDNAPVPGGMCGHPKGRLFDGQRDFGMNGGEWITKTARGRVGGGSVAVVSIGCTAGGVSWPETLVFYGRGSGGRATLLTHLYLGRFRAAEHASVETTRIKDRTLRLTWSTYNGCCFETRPYSATMRLKGSEVLVSNLRKGPMTNPYE